jgi:hypothetical protein
LAAIYDYFRLAGAMGDEAPADEEAPAAELEVIDTGFPRGDAPEGDAPETSRFH